MMADPETGTDSAASGTTPPETPAPSNDQAQTSAATAETTNAPPTFDEDFLKRLDELDPTTLPPERRQKLEAPFKSDYTKKTQELAEERKRFDIERQTTFDAVRKIVEARGNVPQGPTPLEERIKELRDLAAAGDGAALEQLAEIKAQQIVQPMQTQFALRSAAETAMNANPYVKANWGQIISTIEGDPTLKEICTASNYKYADKVMIALGLELQARDLAGKLSMTQKEFEAAKAKIAVLEKERAASLPSKTSTAGTSTGAPASERPPGLMNAARKAWVDLGYREEDFR
jgi:hypothetical protein